MLLRLHLCYLPKVGKGRDWARSNGRIFQHTGLKKHYEQESFPPINNKIIRWYPLYESQLSAEQNEKRKEKRKKEKKGQEQEGTIEKRGKIKRGLFFGRRIPGEEVPVSALFYCLELLRLSLPTSKPGDPSLFGSPFYSARDDLRAPPPDVLRTGSYSYYLAFSIA